MNTLVDKSHVAAKVKQIFHEKLGVDETSLAPNASFSNDLGLDSLDVLETFMAIEKEYGIRITDEEAENLTTVGLVIDYIIDHVH
jgi:acyl carrier protein